MKRRLKLALLTLLTLTATLPNANAGIDTALKDYYKELKKNAAITRPNAYKAQERGYVTIGGIYYKSPDMTIQPLSITPPDFSIGCDGIDFTFGSFSYLSTDQLVEFLRNMIDSAPAVFFEVALGKYLTSLKNILNELNQAANIVNSMTVSSCQATRALASKAKALIAGETAAIEQQTTNEGAKSGTCSDFLSCMNEKIKDFKKAWDSFLSTTSGGNFVEEMKKKSGSFIYRMLEAKYGKGFEKSTFGALKYRLLTSLVGDVIFTLKKDTSSVKSPADAFNVTFVSPSLKSATFLVDASSNPLGKIYRIGNATDPKNNEFVVPDVKHLDDAETVMRNFCIATATSVFGAPSAEAINKCKENPGFLGVMESVIDDIRMKMEAGNPLSPGEVDFIKMSPLPVLKWMKTMALYPEASSSFSKALSEYIAYYYALSLVDDLVKSMSPIPWTDMSKEQQEFVLRLYQQATKVKGELEDTIGKKKDIISTFMKLNNFVNIYEKATAVKLAEQNIWGKL